MPGRSAIRRLPALRLAALAGLTAATLAGPLASSAWADNDHDRRNEPHRQSEPHRQQAHRQEPPHYGGYDHRPDVYYSAPPVVYEPPVYQQPGPVLSLTIPFFYR